MVDAAARPQKSRDDRGGGASPNSGNRALASRNRRSLSGRPHHRRRGCQAMTGPRRHGEETEAGPILVTGVAPFRHHVGSQVAAKSPGTALAGVGADESARPSGTPWAGLSTAGPGYRVHAPTAIPPAAAYHGWNPMVYSRSGSRQWAGPLPSTRLVVKDPYALLSMPAVARATGATPVLVYRHPGAILTSYRRVDWRPRLDELALLAQEARSTSDTLDLPEIPDSGDASSAEEMGVFWSVLHELALRDAAACGALIVSHAELASGGVSAARRLASILEPQWSAAMGEEFGDKSSAEVADPAKLHNFDRSPASVADEWRSKLADDDVRTIERVGGEHPRRSRKPAPDSCDRLPTHHGSVPVPNLGVMTASASSTSRVRVDWPESPTSGRATRRRPRRAGGHRESTHMNRSRGTSRLRATTTLGTMVLALAASTSIVTTADAAMAAKAVEVEASWEMNEPAGATTMVDSGPNGFDTPVDQAGIDTGFGFDGATAYSWPRRPPTWPPASPERVIQIP